jgi:hypothetical protein
MKLKQVVIALNNLCELKGLAPVADPTSPIISIAYSNIYEVKVSTFTDQYACIQMYTNFSLMTIGRLVKPDEVPTMRQIVMQFNTRLK